MSKQQSLAAGQAMEGVADPGCYSKEFEDLLQTQAAQGLQMLGSLGQFCEIEGRSDLGKANIELNRLDDEGLGLQQKAAETKALNGLYCPRVQTVGWVDDESGL